MKLSQCTTHEGQNSPITTITTITVTNVYKKFEFIDALIPFYINPNNNTNPNPNNTNMGRIHFSTLLLSFILLLLGSLALGAGTIRPSTATLIREVAKAKAMGHTALVEQYNRLSSQSVVAPRTTIFRHRYLYAVHMHCLFLGATSSLPPLHSPSVQPLRWNGIV